MQNMNALYWIVLELLGNPLKKWTDMDMIA
jgi:hypothetical protein